MKSRKKHNRSKLNRKITVAVTSLTAAAVMESAVFYAEEPVQALAKESFKGIRQIVQEHEEDPFVILDVVPGTGVLDWTDADGGIHSYEFSLGTIAYLNGSPAPIEEDLKRIFTSEEEQTLFYSYSNRLALAESVVPAGYESDESGFQIIYEEAYGGISAVRESDGWIKLYDPVETDDEEKETVMPVGIIRGIYEKVSEGEGAFELLDENGDISTYSMNSGDGQDIIYTPDQEGNYRVTFAEAGEATEGYIAAVISADLSAYSAATNVYRLIDGKYVYIGQVRDVIEIEDDEPETEETVLDQPGKEDTSADADDEPEGNGSDDKTDDEEENDSGEPENDGQEGDPDDGGERIDSDVTDEEEIQQDTTVDSSSTQNDDWQKFVAQGVDAEEYYIVNFEYVSGLEEAQTIYEVADVYMLSENGGIRPYDAYMAVSSENEDLVNSVNTGENETDTADVSFLYVGEGNGRYQLTESREEDALVIEVKNAPVWFRCCKNNDWIKKYVFNALKGGDNESDDFEVEVQVIQADELDYNAVYGADLVFLEAGAGEFLQNTVQKSYMDVSSGSDLSVDAAHALIERAVDELMPVIVDYGIVSDTENYKDSVYQKTAEIFRKKNLSAFFYEMNGSPDNMFMNRNQDIKDDNQFHYVNKNIYFINGLLVGSDFDEAFDDDEIEAGFQEIEVAIDAENTTISEEEDKLSHKISKAKVIQYIINYAVGMIGDFDVLNILELQPSANEAADLRFEENGDTILVWQKKDSGMAGKQLLRSTGEIAEKNIEVKSVAEFNGEWEDINSVYQMIFIGLDGQRLNKDGSTGETRYNNADLNGTVYHTGDKTGGLGDQTYDANDITEQKKYDLLEFMRAGYPIVLEDDFFRDATAQGADADDINTDYIAADTQMYDFLMIAINDEEIQSKKALYTISDLHSSAYFQAQLSAARPLIAYQDEDADRIMIMTEDAEEKGRYSGSFAYRITDQMGEEYIGDTSLRFYVDMNGDGIYDESELLSEDRYSMDNGVLTLRTYAVSEGILSWKLEVSDAGNEYRRSSISGYFRCSAGDALPIRILQVTDESDLDNPAVNMQDMLGKNNRMLLGLYLQRAESLINAEYDITTLSLERLETKLESEETSRYLNEFDIVVLSVSGMEAADSTVNAVNDYISEGRSVLITCSGEENDDQKMGLNASLLGLSQIGTYGRLGKESGSYYRYSGLDADTFYNMNNLYAEQINEGIIFQYPYVIDNTIYFSDESTVGMPDYLLDFSSVDLGEARTTAWCTLNSTDDAASAFQVSVRDAGNNYYAYSKGNVVYIGQKLYPYTYETEDFTEGEGTVECQFFVNALMCAYHAGIHNSDISIVAGFGSAAASIDSISIPFDQVINDSGDSQGGILDETVDVYFKFTDNNIALQKEVTIRFYYEDPDGTPLDLGDKTVNATEFTGSIDTVENNKLVEADASAMNQGQVYRIKAPVVALQKDAGVTNADIYVVLENVFSKAGREYQIISNASVSLNRAQLFLLE